MRSVCAVLLLLAVVGCLPGIAVTAIPEGQPSATLPGPLRFVRPATLGSVSVKMVQVARAIPPVVLGGGTASFAAGALPAGSHVALVWAGRKLAEGLAGSDGSLAVGGLPQDLSAAWVLYSDQPVPDLQFERYGTVYMPADSSWGGCYGFSGRLPILLTFTQNSGWADVRLWVWDHTRWVCVWVGSYSYRYLSVNGLVDEGGRVLFAAYDWSRGYVVRAYDPASGVSEVVRLGTDGARLFRGGDGRTYVWTNGLWWLDGSFLVRVAAKLPDYERGYAVAGTGDIFGVQLISSAGYFVRRWSGSAWVPASCPFDGSSGAIVIVAGPQAVWALSGGQVSRLEDGIWSQPEFPCGVPAQSLYPTPDGSCWALVNNAGTLQLAQWSQGAGWVLGPLMPQGAQWILGDDPEGNLWVGGPGCSPVPVYKLPLGLLR